MGEATDGSTDVSNIEWSEPLTEEEKQVYINENKEVPSYKSDSSTLEHFGKSGFLKALSYMEMV